MRRVRNASVGLTVGSSRLKHTFTDRFRHKEARADFASRQI